MAKRRESGTPLSQAAYARHRAALGLDGATRRAVHRAIRSGRLNTSIVIVDGRPMIADPPPELADRERSENTARPAPAALAPEVDAGDDEISYQEARRRREIERWRLSEIAREREALELRHVIGGDYLPRTDFVALREAFERYGRFVVRFLRHRIPHRMIDHCGDYLPQHVADRRMFLHAGQCAVDAALDELVDSHPLADFIAKPDYEPPV